MEIEQEMSNEEAEKNLLESFEVLAKSNADEILLRDIFFTLLKNLVNFY
jgi:hypothetical protein